MIIVSQDKTSVVNFNNVNTLFATKKGEILSFNNSYKSEDDCSDILGNYETEERAKEVLNEIKDAYSATQLIMMPEFKFGKPTKAGNIAKVISYEMPEK